MTFSQDLTSENYLLGDPNMEAERKLSMGDTHNRSMQCLRTPLRLYRSVFSSREHSRDLNSSELNMSHTSAASCDYRGDVMEEFDERMPANFKTVKFLTPMLMSESKPAILQH